MYSKGTDNAKIVTACEYKGLLTVKTLMGVLTVESELIIL